jgi:hypothetical protein
MLLILPEPIVIMQFHSKVVVGLGRKVLITKANAAVDLAAAQHLLGPLAFPFLGRTIIYFIRGPRSSSFWFPRILSYNMERQARNGDTVLALRVER